MKLIDNLHAYLWRGRDNNCNTYLFSNVLKDGKHLIIDPGHVITPFYREHAFEHLIREIEVDGLRIEDIGLIINTHLHSDHCEANSKLMEKSKASLAFHDAEFHREKFKATFFLKEGKLELGKINLEIYHTPGHTPGHISIYSPANKVLITGDVIFYRCVGRTDLPGGDRRELRKSIERLSQLDVEYLLPGHNYNFPPRHVGYIKGKDEVERNFSFVKRFF